MESIIDKYLNNYDTYEKGKNTFESDIGTITFMKNNRSITVFEIYIELKYRQTGQCKKFLEYLIDRCIDLNINIEIISVISKILYNYLCRFTYKGLKFKLNKNGFILNIK